GLAGVAAWFQLSPAPEPAPPAGASAPAPGDFRLSDAEMRAIRIEPVALRDFRPERVAEGRIAYNDDRSTPVLSPYTGRVLRAFVRVGDTVTAGQPLFEIESSDVTGAANDLLSAADNVQKTRVALDQARREETRQASLFSARAASQRDVEQARAAARAAEADDRSAQAQLAAARDKLRVLGRAPAQIEEIERTRQVSGVINVTAPIAGTVTQRRVGPGQWVSAGQGDPVVTISDLSTMWLVAAVREMDVPLIRPGQTVQVRVGALPDRPFEARIVRMAPGLDAQTRRLTVMAEVQDPQNLLKPEMFATFHIAVGESAQLPAVPTSAVIHRGAESHAWVALEGNRFELRRITTGTRSGDQLAVTDGLRAGERLVTGGALFIDRAARID
ncbi:MAG: efflux RND transporter periplasmic adaptor subunit, partial [Acetobacteraceae bacterium]|nr:efflux RND transporter periplasmic adaptor subunit [Acetobacteraceae bacterium]